MADDKDGRENQAQNETRRQRERDIQTELERGDEPRPPLEDTELSYFEDTLDTLTFPATGREVVETVGDRQLEAGDDTVTVAELVPETATETFDSPGAVRVRVQRPTVAAAMKQVLEAVDTLPDATMGTSQRDVYEKTFRELAAIEADDDDEGIRVVSDWIVEQIHEKAKLPGSRAVRRRAAKFCRSEGYQVSADEWLGI